jgi:hypothetical protein
LVEGCDVEASAVTATTMTVAEEDEESRVMRAVIYRAG